MNLGRQKVLGENNDTSGNQVKQGSAYKFKLGSELKIIMWGGHEVWGWDRRGEFVAWCKFPWYKYS